MKPGVKRELTEDEIKYVKENYRQLTVREMARHIGISWDTLKKRIDELGLKVDIQNNEWTEVDINKLRSLSYDHSVSEIASILDRSENSIYIKARRLGIRLCGPNLKWTVEDKDYLRRNWGKVNISTIASNLRRNVDAVAQQAHKMKLPSIIRSSEDIPLSDFFNATGISRDRIVNTLVPKYDFPLKSKKYGKKQYYYYVDYTLILDWMQRHQGLYNGALIKEDFFIPEPKWLKTKRSYDKEHPEDLYYQFRKKAWTAEEDRLLCDLIEIGLDYQQIGERLMRSASSVEIRANKLGKSYRLKKFWKGKEFKFIIENSTTMSDKEMAEKLNRPVKSVAGVRQTLGYKRDGNRVKQAEIDYVLKNWETISDKEMAEHLNRNIQTIEKIRRKLGLSRNSNKIWSESEISYIRDNYENKSDKEMAEALGRTESAVSIKRTNLRLLRNKKNRTVR